MDQKEIKKTWRKLIVPFLIGITILVTSILAHRLGSKRPGPQTIWLFSGILGGVLTLFPGLKMLKFNRYLNKNGLK